ncbi:hypothetical protein [Methylobacter sp. S3L5C]|uniref:hypothetical protein n=1 Tax=Methylobacter sp. S3L5C TaxID=2839024 RepID=UPI001FAC1BB4|nr:hypothetical protein [Methylobacter sp. S3L5C]UOA08901.1 hypothetical protein KKZ03_00860 [Methylobacter sp. S3L5C]
MARAGTQIREAFTTINKPRRLTILVSRYPEQGAVSSLGTDTKEAFTMINKPRRLAVLVSRYPE